MGVKGGGSPPRHVPVTLVVRQQVQLRRFGCAARRNETVRPASSVGASTPSKHVVCNCGGDAYLNSPVDVVEQTMTDERGSKRAKVAVESKAVDVSRRVTDTAALDQLVRMFLTFREMAISQRVNRRWQISAHPTVVFGSGASGRAAVEAKTQKLAVQHVRKQSTLAAAEPRGLVRSFAEAVQIGDIETAVSLLVTTRRGAVPLVDFLRTPSLYTVARRDVLDAIVKQRSFSGPQAFVMICGVLSDAEAGDYFAATLRTVRTIMSKVVGSAPRIHPNILVPAMVRVNNMVADAVIEDILEKTPDRDWDVFVTPSWDVWETAGFNATTDVKAVADKSHGHWTESTVQQKFVRS